MKAFAALALGLGFLAGSVGMRAQPFLPPTSNRALFEPNGEKRYFTGTADKSWTTGTFGCVRSGGHQLHEGIDIRCLTRDARGEPRDPVFAAADGTVAYVNRKEALSNYGIYLVVGHRREGLEFFTLYAHLARIPPELRAGTVVKAGAVIGTMGRTSNTRQHITRERAHLHFEVNFRLNERFAAWHKATHKGEHNDHGDWNGRNLVGLDPAGLLLTAARDKNFSLLRFVGQQPELCRVRVRKTGLSYLRRNPALVARNPRAERAGVVGYELVINAAGMPCRATPLTAVEFPGTAKTQLVFVNENEANTNGCRHLVQQRNGRWELGPNGQQLMSLLTY